MPGQLLEPSVLLTAVASAGPPWLSGVLCRASLQVSQRPGSSTGHQIGLLLIHSPCSPSLRLSRLCSSLIWPLGMLAFRSLQGRHFPFSPCQKLCAFQRCLGCRNSTGESFPLWSCSDGGRLVCSIAACCATAGGRHLCWGRAPQHFSV